jgi:hypothetical protein
MIAFIVKNNVNDTRKLIAFVVSRLFSDTFFIVIISKVRKSKRIAELSTAAQKFAL